MLCGNLVAGRYGRSVRATTIDYYNMRPHTIELPRNVYKTAVYIFLERHFIAFAWNSFVLYAYSTTYKCQSKTLCNRIKTVVNSLRGKKPKRKNEMENEKCWRVAHTNVRTYSIMDGHFIISSDRSSMIGERIERCVSVSVSGSVSVSVRVCVGSPFSCYTVL